jgi:hypothetical protein
MSMRLRDVRLGTLLRQSSYTGCAGLNLFGLAKLPDKKLYGRPEIVLPVGESRSIGSIWSNPVTQSFEAMVSVAS